MHLVTVVGVDVAGNVYERGGVILVDADAIACCLRISINNDITIDSKLFIGGDDNIACPINGAAVIFHLVDFVGSDAHRDSGRDTDMRAGAAVIRELAGEAVLQQLTQINPQRIIDGTPLKVNAPQQLITKEKKSKWWKRLFK